MSLLAYTAVIPHYGPERVPNLRVLVDALRSNTMPPQEIIIWDNDRSGARLKLGEGVTIIGAERNVGPQARLLAACIARTPMILFQDNDIAMQPQAVRNLFTWADCFPDSVVTMEGRIRKGEHYGHWPKLYGRALDTPRLVDLSLGRGELMPRGLARALVSLVPFEGVMDDLYIGAGLKRMGVEIRVVPCADGESWLRNLPAPDALCKRPDYGEARDRVIKEVW